MRSADIRHDLQIIPCSFFTSEAAGHLGFDFYHSKIPFSLIVIKRDKEVLGEKADGCLVQSQTFHNVSSYRIFLDNNPFNYFPITISLLILNYAILVSFRTVLVDVVSVFYAHYNFSISNLSINYQL